MKTALALIAMVVLALVALFAAPPANGPGQSNYPVSVSGSCSTNQVIEWNGTKWVCGSGGGSGTVTSVATGAGLTGGPITTSGTIVLGNVTLTIPPVDTCGAPVKAGSDTYIACLWGADVITNLAETPVTQIPAQGANTTIVVTKDYEEFIFGTDAFSAGLGGSILGLSEGTVSAPAANCTYFPGTFSGLAGGTNINNALGLDGQTDRQIAYGVYGNFSSTIGDGGSSVASDVINTPVVLCNNGDDWTDGTGSEILVILGYQVFPAL